MVKHTEKLLTQALQLPPIERAELIERLFLSFEFPSRNSIDNLWSEEVESRIDAYEKGELKGLSAENVFKKINSK